MKRKSVSKLLYVLAILLLAGCGGCLGVDYYQYSTTLNSAPFSVWILSRVVQFGLPIILTLVVAYILGKPGKEEQ